MADLSTIKTQLLGRLYRADDIPATPDTGVYALYLSDLHALEGIEVDPFGLLYVGMTEDSLEIRNHFAHKNSSFSSPRRSLGAIVDRYSAQLGKVCEGYAQLSLCWWR